MLTKVFQSGNSQAVRIPAIYRLDTDTVEITPMADGSLLLSPKPACHNGTAFLEAFSGFDEAFIEAVEKRENLPIQEREAF
ncbi:MULTISPECIES: antitoxin [Rodentibacter]|uniref:antitoxin n=1 Tax=Rodentibacter TaxID=1960084 RepID=UPI001CFF4C9C|nr:AbrB/MazE/SpoVT family DNA-binding domain-containing protein [Rodentibacter sp. JRC1]GJI56907.1 antitoxin VapB1 [Rodentibacter sp. JRC1]